MVSLEEQIKLLIGLQKLDKQIFKLRRDLESQPILIRAAEESLKAKEAGLKKKEEEAKALAVKRKEKEIELQAKEDGIKKLQGQLYQIKTNKEYQAMEKEIAGKKADISVIEEEIIKIFDQIDECAKGAAKEKETLSQERRVFDEEKKKIEASSKEMEVAMQKLNAERSELAQKIDKEYLSKYERILHSKNGLAMVNVEHEACGGCNINLPPQVINEIRLKEELIFCGNCARILYIEEEQGGGQ
ncbi:MAG: C4-type zinc ribbon domain-containing protein [Candidatus Omnitrophota bacterium]